MIDRTIREEPVDPRILWSLAAGLLNLRAVVYMPKEGIWRRGYIVAVVPSRDVFRVKWSKYGKGRNQKGIWRVHPDVLFTADQFLPVPLESASLTEGTNPKKPKEGTMAPRGSKTTAAKAAKPKAKAAPAKPATTRVADKLEGLTDAKKRNIAKLIYRERSKSPATSWPDVQQMVEDKYDWTLPGSMTGRRLLREFGPEEAEDAIIKQNRESNGDGAKKTAKKTTAKAATPAKKKTKKVVEEVEDDEEYEDDEELEEDLEDEDEDEDEDEEDEDEEEEPTPRRRVRVSRGRGKKS